MRRRIHMGAGVRDHAELRFTETVLFHGGSFEQTGGGSAGVNGHFGGYRMGQIQDHGALRSFFVFSR